jgi:hypothetical protein
MKYLLTVFVCHKNQENFAITLAEEIQGLCKSSVKYFFGEQTILITFETKIKFGEVSDFFDGILGGLSIPYVVAPTDKMSYWFNKENEKHLFGTDLCTTNEEYSQEEQDDFIDDLLGGLNNLSRQMMEDGEWGSAPSRRSEHRYDDLFGEQKKNIKEEPTLDELLDKINVSGIKSLTTEEKELLNKYSK